MNGDAVFKRELTGKISDWCYSADNSDYFSTCSHIEMHQYTDVNTKCTTTYLRI